MKRKFALAAGIGGAVAVAFINFPEGGVDEGLSPIVNALFALVGAALTIAARRGAGKASRLIVTLLLGFFAVTLFGLGVEALIPVTASASLQHSVPEIALIAALVPYCLAFLLLIRSVSRVDNAAIGDGLIFGIGIAMSVWILAIDPAMETSDFSDGHLALLLVDILGNLVVVTAVAATVARVGLRNRVLNWAAFATTAFALASVVVIISHLSSTPLRGLEALADALQDFSFIVIGAAAYALSKHTKPLLVRDGVSNTHPVHVFMLLAMPFLIPLVTLIIATRDDFAERTQNDPYDIIIILVASMITTLLVAMRVSGLLRKEQTLSRQLDDAYKEIQTQDLTLRHSQKMEAIGRLAAGVAHEINTPIQFIGLNLEYLQSELRESALRSSLDTSLTTRAHDAIDDSLDGIHHISKIVSAVKAFGHPGSEDMVDVDVNEVIKNTLVVATNMTKAKADVQVELGDLPHLPCLQTELSQVFLNLIMNAVDAISETGRRGVVTVRTTVEDASAVIAIADTGTGMSPEVLSKAFEPMFTTKAIGLGSGIGLALCWSTIVDQHQGSLTCESEPGMGSTFTIRLPLSRTADQSSASTSANGDGDDLRTKYTVSTPGARSSI